jgi:hypothetical protein
MRTGILKLAEINNDLLHQHIKPTLHALEYTYTLPNQSKPIKLIDISHHFPYNVIFLLYFILFIAELHMRPHLPRFYHNTFLYCVLSL